MAALCPLGWHRTPFTNIGLEDVGIAEKKTSTIFKRPTYIMQTVPKENWPIAAKIGHDTRSLLEHNTTIVE